MTSELRGNMPLQIPSDHRILVSFSSGKDCSWMLHVLRQAGANVVGLLTTFNESADRASMHATRRRIVEAQAQAAGFPLWPIMLPFPCSNADYEQRMAAAMDRAKRERVTHMAFGDLYLEDIREYRRQKLAPTGIEPIFPIWTGRNGTHQLARQMINAGLRAKLSSVDPKQIPASFAGREYDHKLLADLPPTADPCGENGEFHTICYAGPMYKNPLALSAGPIIERDGFHYADFALSDGL